MTSTRRQEVGVPGLLMQKPTCFTTGQNLIPRTEGPQCPALWRNPTQDFSKDRQEAPAVRQPRQQSQTRRGLQVPAEGSPASPRAAPPSRPRAGEEVVAQVPSWSWTGEYGHTLTQCKPATSYCPQGQRPETALLPPGSRGASSRCRLKGPFPSPRPCDALRLRRTSTLQMSVSQDSLTLFTTIEDPNDHWFIQVISSHLCCIRN